MNEESLSPDDAVSYALEGENLCKQGNCVKGIFYLEHSLKSDIKDPYLLSSIYSLLGNAYFCLHDYEKARKYHQQDLDLSTSKKDIRGEARACGNMCIASKALGHFDDAFNFCNRHIGISSKIGDEEGLARAYYNKGNLYYSWARKACQLNSVFPGTCPEDLEGCLKEALNCYKLNLNLNKRLKNDVLLGKCLGNVANVHYLLGQFDTARQYQLERLKLATRLRDVHGMRRAHANLGNCFVFLEQFSSALRHYQQSHELSREIGDQMLESRALFNIGHVHSILSNFPLALEHFQNHLKVARQYRDEADEARCWWSLAEVYEKTGDATRAEKCIENFKKLKSRDKIHLREELILNLQKPWSWLVNVSGRRGDPPERKGKNTMLLGNEDYMDMYGMIFRFQSRRIEDQRYPLNPSSGQAGSSEIGTSSQSNPAPGEQKNITETSNETNVETNKDNSEESNEGSSETSPGEEAKFEEIADRIADFQRPRMDAQRSDPLTSTPKRFPRRSLNGSFSSLWSDIQGGRLSGRKTDLACWIKSKRRRLKRLRHPEAKVKNKDQK